MKTILKTISKEEDLNYNSTFTSKKNLEVRYRLILELQKLIVLNYHSSANQLISWLKSIHKSHYFCVVLKKAAKIAKIYVEFMLIIG